MPSKLHRYCLTGRGLILPLNLSVHEEVLFDQTDLIICLRFVCTQDDLCVFRSAHFRHTLGLVQKIQIPAQAEAFFIQRLINIAMNILTQLDQYSVFHIQLTVQ